MLSWKQQEHKSLHTLGKCKHIYTKEGLEGTWKIWKEKTNSNNIENKRRKYKKKKSLLSSLIIHSFYLLGLRVLSFYYFLSLSHDKLKFN